MFDNLVDTLNESIKEINIEDTLNEDIDSLLDEECKLKRNVSILQNVNLLKMNLYYSLILEM